MKKIISKLFGSLDTHTIDSFSGRKLSVVASLTTALCISSFKLPEADRIYAVYALLAFSAVCLGLVTIPQLIEFLSGKKTETKTTIIEQNETKQG